MGHARNRPKLLPEKLRLIRLSLKINQANMAEQLVSEIESHSQRRIGIKPSYISKFELGKRVPDLVVMMGYGRLGKVHLESVADDNVSVEAFGKRLGKEFTYRRKRPNIQRRE